MQALLKSLVIYLGLYLYVLFKCKKMAPYVSKFSFAINAKLHNLVFLSIISNPNILKILYF